jgi:hypothetical protein
MSSLFQFPPYTISYVENDRRTYYWCQEKTDSLPEMCGLDTYRAMSIEELCSGCYTVQGTGIALTSFTGSPEGYADNGSRTLGDLLHFYRDLRHQATQTTLMKNNTDQSHPIRRACSRLGKVPLMDAISFQHVTELSVLICLNWLGLSKDASIDDFFQVNRRDWAKPAPEWITKAHDMLLDLIVLPCFGFMGDPSTVEPPEHSEFIDSILDLTPYEV